MNSVYVRTDAEVEEVDELHEIKLKGDYAKLGGQYYGNVPGTKIYEFCVNFKLEASEPPTYSRQYLWRELRSSNRKTVREHLKKQYPNAKICR